MAGQVSALMDLVSEVVVHALVSRAKAIKVVLISNLAKGIRSSSLVIKGIRSS